MRLLKWAIPMEAVRAMATGDSIAIITQMALRRHVRFFSQADLVLGENGYFADVRFEEPRYPGLEQSVSLALAVVPQENAMATMANIDAVRT